MRQPPFQARARTRLFDDPLDRSLS